MQTRTVLSKRIADLATTPEESERTYDDAIEQATRTTHNRADIAVNQYDPNNHELGEIFIFKICNIQHYMDTYSMNVYWGKSNGCNGYYEVKNGLMRYNPKNQKLSFMTLDGSATGGLNNCRNIDRICKSIKNYLKKFTSDLLLNLELNK